MKIQIRLQISRLPAAIGAAAGRFYANIKQIAVRVSGLPSYESYSWGPRVSYVAWAFYHSIFLLRLLSLLQIIKALVRQFEEDKPKPRSHPADSAFPLHSSMEDKPRPDFHAADTEIYLLIVLFLSLLSWALFRRFPLGSGRIVFAPASPLAWIGLAVAAYFLAESILWTVYYALFRPLFERARLNLYDEAEYFIMLPVVLTTQTILLALLWNKSLAQVGLMLLNVGDPLGQRTSVIAPTRFEAFSAALLGQTYIVIVIASLIRIVPALHVRKRPNITVIGYGDVVRKRILPAMLALYAPRQIAIAADYLAPEDIASLASQKIYSTFTACKGKADTQADPAKVVKRIVDWTESHSRFAIIAVPTPMHLDYMLQFSRRGIRYGLEKPIVGTEPELDLLSQPSSQELFQNAFVFSYYWLGKGLSLNYLLTLNPIYRPLLAIENPQIAFQAGKPKPEIPKQEIALLLARLGKLQCLTLEFLEETESLDRHWTELRSTGGMVMETLVHPITILVNLARYARAFPSPNGLWATPPNLTWRVHLPRAAQIKARFGQQIGPTYLELHSTLAGGIEVHIRCGKYLVRNGCESRFLIAGFEHGFITTDLSKMQTRVVPGNAAQDQVALLLSSKHRLRSPQTNAPREDAPDGQTSPAKDRVESQNAEASADDPADKYRSQIALLNTFFLDGWGGLRFDDYPSQLDVLRELCAILRVMPEEGSIAGDDDILRVPWIAEPMMKTPSTFTRPRPV